MYQAYPLYTPRNSRSKTASPCYVLGYTLPMSHPCYKGSEQQSAIERGARGLALPHPDAHASRLSGEINDAMMSESGEREMVAVSRGDGDDKRGTVRGGGERASATTIIIHDHQRFASRSTRAAGLLRSLRSILLADRTSAPPASSSSSLTNACPHSPPSAPPHPHLSHLSFISAHADTSSARLKLYLHQGAGWGISVTHTSPTSEVSGKSEGLWKLY